MQAISGALQMTGGIILRLVRQTAIMLARAFAPVVVRSFVRRAVGGRLWFVADAAAGPLRRFVRTCERSASHYCYYCILVQRMLRHVQFSLS